jgi:hypothetical protein
MPIKTALGALRPIYAIDGLKGAHLTSVLRFSVPTLHSSCLSGQSKNDGFMDGIRPEFVPVLFVLSQDTERGHAMSANVRHGVTLPFRFL